MKDEHKTKYKIAISIIFGLLGFTLNFYTINFAFPPYTATVLTGLLFPMLITLTWGWKYGLLSALVGGCQSMWWLWGPSNGYATFFVVPPFTLWIVWHGLFANWRRKQKDHGWWLNTWVVELPFRILGTINLYTLSRWAITLNPPPWSWAADAPNTIPMHFSNFVVIKQAVVGYVILLLADVLLNFRFIRRFFRLKDDYSQTNTGYITSAALLLGILFWALDSTLDYLVFHVGEGSFLDLAVSNIPSDELFERTALVLACLLGGVLSSRFLRKQRQAEEAIRESEEQFRTLVETAPSLLQICDTKDNNIYVSPNCKEMTGYTQEELLGGATWWVYEGDTPEASKFFERAFRKGLGGRDFEYKAVKKNGELWYASSSWEPFRDRHGEFKGVIFQTIDVTERVQAEEALQQYTQQLETLQVVTGALSTSLALDEVLELILEQLAVVVPFDSTAIFLVEDDHLRCVVCQGHPHPEQVLGQLFPADNELVREILTGRLVTLADAQADPRFQRWGGTDYVRGWLGVPLLVREELIGHLTIDSHQPNAYGPAQVALVQPFANQAAQAIENARLHEQAQRHAAELEQRVAERTAELRESEEKSRAQYKGIPVPTYTWQKVGEDLVLVDYNDAALEITQGGVANFVGAKAIEMYQDIPEIRDEIERCFAEKAPIEREMPYHYTTTGESRLLAVKYAFVPPDLVLVHTEDITERVRAQEEIEKRTAELRKMVNLMAGREVRMAELKNAIRELRAQLQEAGITPVADDPLLAGQEE